MGCRRYSAASRLEVLLDEDDFRCSWRARENFLLHSQLHVTILALWSQCLFPRAEWTVVHSRVSPFLFDLCLRVRLCLRIRLQVQQTLTHNSGWILVHPPVSPFLLSFWCLRDQTRHLFRSPGWTIAHPRVWPFLIIGFLVLVGFVGCLCCFQRLLNPNLSSIYLWRESLEEAEVTFYFLVYYYSRFHHNNFRNTISWECIVKDDCVRSCLMELQSFPLSNLYIDPVHRVLVSFPRFLLVPCKTWFGQVKLVRIFVFLVHGIHSRKEYCLSFLAWIVLPVTVQNLWWSVNWLHIQYEKCTRRNCPELTHCPGV